MVKIHDALSLRVRDQWVLVEVRLNLVADRFKLLKIDIQLMVVVVSALDGFANSLEHEKFLLQLFLCGVLTCVLIEPFDHLIDILNEHLPRFWVHILLQFSV